MKVPFSAPTAYQLSGRLLDLAYTNLKDELTPLIEKHLRVYGGSLLLDGASNINGESDSLQFLLV